MKNKIPIRPLIIFVAIWLSGPSCAQGQAITDLVGLSKMTHYTREDYQIETQFWAMAEDDEGIRYFGTSWGISVLNGQNWQSILLPNNSDVRAIHQTKDNRIIVGAYNEFGEVKKDKYGQFYYESLIDLVPPGDLDFDVIWQIESIDDLLIFRSFTSLIFLVANEVTIIPTNDIFWSIDIIEDQILVASNQGIFQLDAETKELALIVNAAAYNYERIVSLLPYKPEEAMIFTRQGNSYTFDPSQGAVKFNMYHLNADSPDQVFCAKRTSDGLYLLGTINNYIKYYNPERPGHEQSRVDLQDKTVLNIYEAHDGSIWALLNRGVDCFDNSFPGTTIFSDASVYDSEFYKDRLIIATNQGTFISKKNLADYPLSSTDFELISGLEAQTWSLQTIEETVFIGHDFGAFYLDEKFKPVYINETYGIWHVIPVRGYPGKFFACGYDGLFLLEKTDNGYRLVHKVQGFSESTRDILPGKQPGEFWISHGFKGVYQIKLSRDLSQVISKVHYTEKNGLPTIYGINVSTYNKENIFLTSDGPYAYVDSLNKFMPQEELQDIFKDNKSVTKLIQEQQTVWFVEENSMGFYSLSNPSILNRNLFASLDGSFITSMEHLYPINSQTVMVGTNTGLYIFRHISPNTNISIPTSITSVSFKDAKDSTHLAELLSDEPVSLEHDISSLQFTYAAQQLSSQKDVQYRYKLDNFDNDWSAWSGANYKEYSFLKPGDYTFKVEAKDVINTKASLATYEFEVLPPWYQTSLSIFIAVTLSLIILAGVFVRLQRGYKNSLAEQARLRKVLELELEHIKLEREKETILKSNVLLEDDILNKSKELANYTLQLAKNQDLLGEVKDTLNAIKKDARLEKTKSSIRNLARKISQSLDSEEHLQIFDTNFEQVHHEFFNELKGKYPDLTQKELRLCGFVKMNMTNKEIASILNISVRGVETARYRLRKHLSLDHDINFVEFLDQLSTNGDVDKNFNPDENQEGSNST